MEKRLFRQVNWMVLAILIVLSAILGVLNNLRVDEEKRVHWLGGSVSSTDDVEWSEEDV